MKIKLSKAQWTEIGIKNNFIKEASDDFDYGPHQIKYWISKIQMNPQIIDRIPENIRDNPIIAKEIQKQKDKMQSSLAVQNKPEQPVANEPIVSVASIKTLKDLYK